MSSIGPLIKGTDLAKTYKIGPRELEVLKGVDVEVGRGEFIALRGASGAGKSTLLHLLGGLDKPSRGTVEFEGRDLKALGNANLATLRNRRIGLIFQSYHLLPDFDALENVCLAASIQRRDPSAAARDAKELLRKVGLEDRVDHRPAELSGGEQQRVAIARSLINQPALILADEPTGNLDSATGDEILDLLEKLREETKVTLIMATHDAAVAARAGRVIELKDGHLAT